MLAPMRRFALAVLFVLLGVVALVPGAARADSSPSHGDAPPDESFSEFVPGASRLEGRLLAPCCWDASRQTLDIHGSPISNELRREIRNRLKQGQSPDAIEADLVRRYTKKILAVPPDNPLPRIGPWLVALLVVGLGLAARAVARWRKQGEAVRLAPEKGPVDEWDQRLDAELEDRD